MTVGRVWLPAAVAVSGEHGPLDNMTMPVIGTFQPVRSRWTWQPRLPELWLRVQEGHHFRMMIEQQKEEV